MSRATHRRSRLTAAVILSAFLAAWVLPAQACAAVATATEQASCPDCTSPCCDPDRCCCTALAAACAASMLPGNGAPAPSLERAVPAPALHLDLSPRVTLAKTTVAPRGRPPAYSPPATLSIRYCTFQE